LEFLPLRLRQAKSAVSRQSRNQPGLLAPF
jgi:hypothetical protein